MRIVVAILLALMAAFVPGAAFAKSVAYVHVQLDYRLDGEDMFKTTAIIKPGDEGILTLRHKTKRPEYQLRYIVSDIGVAANGASVATLSVQVFDGEDGQWILRSSPRAGIALGESASLSGPVRFLDHKVEQYELDAVVTPMTLDEVEKATGARDPSARACNGDAAKGVAEPDGPDGKVAPKRRASCCSSACAAGSIWYGYYLNCCGAIWCCDCGTCCDVP